MDDDFIMPDEIADESEFMTENKKQVVQDQQEQEEGEEEASPVTVEKVAVAECSEEMFDILNEHKELKQKIDQIDTLAEQVSAIVDVELAVNNL